MEIGQRQHLSSSQDGGSDGRSSLPEALTSGVDPARILAETATQRFIPPRQAGESLENIHQPRVLCLGVAGMDQLAYVEAHPQPDEKVRTRQLLRRGGGNAANTATALARLGYRSSL